MRTNEFQVLKIDPKVSLALLISGGAAASTLAWSPAQAATPANVTGAVTDINSTFDALSGVATAAMTVALGVLGIYFAIKYGKKVAGNS